MMIQPGFMVLQSNRLENLRQLCVEWLSRHPLQPLENEVLLVQSNGIAQWLKMALAENPQQGGCGIAAAVDISLPARFLWRAYRAVLGDLPATSPLDKSLLSWRLLRLLPQLLLEPEFSRLHAFMGEEDSARKPYQLALRLADLFDQYQIYRADWLNAWAAGANRLPQAGEWDALSGNNPVPMQQMRALPEDQVWQAALWRRLLADLSDTERSQGRAQIHERFLNACKQLDQHQRPAQLPRRLVVFGISSLPQQTLEVLAALSPVCQVLLCVHNPSPHYWGDLVDPWSARQLFHKAYQRHAPRTGQPSLHELSDDATLEQLYLQANPLLASWGRQGRDYMRLLDVYDQRQHYESLFQQQRLEVDLFEAPAEQHLLGQLQSDIYHLRSLDEAKALQRRPATDDLSLSFHRAHSSQREVEILHDHLLSLFARDSTLRPRDILVMVPDINQFAPHVRAVFGRLSRQDTRYIPFTLSDQGQRQQAPLLMALAQLLDLPRLRCSVSELLDLLDVAALRQAFAIDEEALPLLQRWIRGAGIRWGLHAEQRQQLDLPAHLEQNTWLFGLRRMLLGYATGRSDAWQDIEPYAEVGGLSAELAGKLMHLISALDESWNMLQEDATPSIWVERLHTLLERFFLATDEQDAQLLSRVDQHLEEWLHTCELAQLAQPLAREVVRDHLLERLDEPGLTQRFLAGAVNFATLMPMRAIPFRHICLLGMNDGDYPRQVVQVDFDLMREDYRPGDRSRREDDRYLFLEALLSARDALYISWSGRSIRDNSERQPSVLIGQLRDQIEAVYGADTLTALTRDYPLQPFSRQYFRHGSGHATYAHEWQDVYGTEAITGTELPPLSEARTLSLAHLSQLLRNPAECFFRQRLDVQFSADTLLSDDEETFAVDGLLSWQLRQQLLQDTLRACQQQPDAELDTLLEEQLARLRRSGALPLPPFADLEARRLLQPLPPLLAQWRLLHDQHPLSRDHELTLSCRQGVIHLQDRLSDIHYDNSGAAMRCILLPAQLWSGKSVKWHYLAREWPAHLAAQLQGPVTTHLLGPDTQEHLPALSHEQAHSLLTDLLDLYRMNLQQPLSAACKTSCTYLSTPAEKDPCQAAARAYDGDRNHQGEVENSLALYRLWPNSDALLQQPDFIDHSQQLYQPLMDHWHGSRTEESC